MRIKKLKSRKSNIKKSNIKKSKSKKSKSKKLNFHGGNIKNILSGGAMRVNVFGDGGDVSNSPSLGYERRRQKRLKRDAKKAWGRLKRLVEEGRLSNIDGELMYECMRINMEDDNLGPDYPTVEQKQADLIKNISALLNLGANVNFQDKDLNTPLMYATYYNNIDIVRLLIAREEINLDIQNKFGETALYLAAKKGNYEILTLLLQNNANSTINNYKNISPLNISYLGYQGGDCEKCFKAIFRKNVYNLLGADNITAFDEVMQEDVNIVDFILDGFDWKGEGKSTGNFVYRLGDGDFKCASLEYLKQQYRLKDDDALTPDFRGGINPYTGEVGVGPQPAGYDFDDYNVYYECNNNIGAYGPQNVNTQEQYIKMVVGLVLDPYWFGTLDGPNMFNGIEAHNFQIPMFLGSDTIGIYTLQPYKLIKSVVEKKIFRFKELWLDKGLPVPDIVVSGDHCVNNGNDIQTYQLTRDGDGAFIVNKKPIIFKK